MTTLRKLTDMKAQSFVPMYCKLLADVDASSHGDSVRLSKGEVWPVKQKGPQSFAMIGEQFVEIMGDEFDLILWRFEPRRTS